MEAGLRPRRSPLQKLRSRVTFLGQGRTINIGQLAVGHHRIEARVQGSLYEATVRFQVVAGPNQPPQTTISAYTVTATAGAPIAIDVSLWFTDADGDSLTYSASNLPSWLSLTGSLLTGAPQPSDPSVTVEVSAHDGADSSSAIPVSVRVVVAPIVWVGTEGSDFFRAGPLDDTLSGRGGDDDLHGEAGDDTLYGEAGRDTLRAGEGNDDLFGGPDRDTLDGGPGNDRLEGGPGDDLLAGGDDELRSGIRTFRLLTAKAKQERCMKLNGTPHTSETRIEKPSMTASA